MSGGDRKVREVDTLQGKKKRAQTELTSPSYEQNTKVGDSGILRKTKESLKKQAQELQEHLQDLQDLQEHLQDLF